MKLKLQQSRWEANDVFTFIFIPEQPLKWRAGQSIRLELPIGSYDTEEKRFTISSAPLERHIAVTTRISNSPFKQALKQLRPGKAVQGSAIEGDFTWHDSKTRHILIAGGMGITPFYAMLKQRSLTRQPIKAELFYNGIKNTMPFIRQLRQWSTNFPEFNVQFFVDKNTAFEDLPKLEDSLVYIAGPSTMVQIWQQQLLTRGILQSHIKTDQFRGY